MYALPRLGTVLDFKMETPTVEIPATAEVVDLEMGDEGEMGEEDAPADAPLDVAFGADGGDDDDVNGDEEEEPNAYIE